MSARAAPFSLRSASGRDRWTTQDKCAVQSAAPRLLPPLALPRAGAAAHAARVGQSPPPLQRPTVARDQAKCPWFAGLRLKFFDVAALERMAQPAGDVADVGGVQAIEQLVEGDCVGRLQEHLGKLVADRRPAIAVEAQRRVEAAVHRHDDYCSQPRLRIARSRSSSRLGTTSAAPAARKASATAGSSLDVQATTRTFGFLSVMRAVAWIPSKSGKR